MSNKVADIYVFEDGKLVYFKFPYNEVAIKSFRELPYDSRDPAFGRGWNKGGRCWIFNIELAYQIESIIEQAFDKETNWMWCHTLDELLEAK